MSLSLKYNLAASSPKTPELSLDTIDNIVAIAAPILATVATAGYLLWGIQSSDPAVTGCVQQALKETKAKSEQSCVSPDWLRGRLATCRALGTKGTPAPKAN